MYHSLQLPGTHCYITVLQRRLCAATDGRRLESSIRQKANTFTKKKTVWVPLLCDHGWHVMSVVHRNVYLHLHENACVQTPRSWTPKKNVQRRDTQPGCRDTADFICRFLPQLGLLISAQGVLHDVRARPHRTGLVVDVNRQPATPARGSTPAPVSADAAYESSAAATVEARGRPGGAAGFFRPPGDLPAIPGDIEQRPFSVWTRAQRERKVWFQSAGL